MDNTLYQSSVKRAHKGTQSNSTMVKSAYIQLYPDSAEREMRRISNASMNIVGRELKRCLPEIMKAYDQEIRTDSRMDGITDLRDKIRRRFGSAEKKIEKEIDESGLDNRIAKAASMVKKTVIREWNKTVQKTFGVEVLDDSNKDEIYREALSQWTSDSSDRMRSVPSSLLEKLEKIIEDGYEKRTPVSVVKKKIQEAFSSAKRSAASSAAGSVSELNYECTKATQEDAGVKEYYWYTRRDFRVRPCHASLDGKQFRWDGPPEMWYETKHEGRVYTGRYCHPGQDYNCRCRAVPVFDKSTFKVPVSNPLTEW